MSAQPTATGAQLGLATALLGHHNAQGGEQGGLSQDRALGTHTEGLTGQGWSRSGWGDSTQGEMGLKSRESSHIQP